MTSAENASVDDFVRQVSQTSSVLSHASLVQEDIDFHLERATIAKEVLQNLMVPEDNEQFDKADGSDGLEPPKADVPEWHFKRRQLANEVLAATEDYMMEVVDASTSKNKKASKRGRMSCIADGYLGEEARVNPKITKALAQAVAQRGLLYQAAAFGEFAPRPSTKTSDKQPAEDVLRSTSAPNLVATGLNRRRATVVGSMDDIPVQENSSFLRKVSTRTLSKDSVKVTTKASKRASVIHDEMNHLLKTDGIGMARLTPLSQEKPVLKDPLGIQCVAHLRDRKWTKLARAIRDSIYDPDFYDDGTYGPMYVRLAIHGAATWDQHDQTGGLEGAAMRFKPEYSDAHNKFCKEIIRRQHEMLKVPFPWASYADIQCLCAYVSLECANGPVIPFTPGRRDVIPPKDLKKSVGKLDGEEFVLLNYRERGDVGREDEPVRCPASGQLGECPFLRKMRVFPGRVPGPEQGHLGPPCAPVTPEAEKKEMEEVAKHIREIFVERIGASDQHTVALIAGGHSLGRCHPQISGYAGPWQSNPGYFNNVYCKKLLSDDWKIVDRNMQDCSGDLITGLKPYGMRRQYVNKGGKGDLMMLVSDMALREDPKFGFWIRKYADDNELLKKDFGVAFKWITELGFTPPNEKSGLAKLKINLQNWASDCFRGIGEFLCPFDTSNSAASASGTGGVIADAPKVGDPYTIDEVKTHTSKTDCWVVINGKVCNLTEFMNRHPGGIPVIMNKAGQDASNEWNSIHSRDAIEKICPEVVIGHLVSSKTTKLKADDSKLMGALLP